MEDTVIKEVIKKSELAAKDAYEYQWITYPEYGFLQSHIEEKTEELEITYDLENRRSFTEIRKEDLPDILLVLDDIGNLKKYLEKYSFSLQPQNLFYDLHGSVKAKSRDVLSASTDQEEQFLNAYKAVVGYALQNKYTFEDYLQGGMQLLGKEGVLGQVQSGTSVEDIQKILCEEYERIKKDRREKKVLIPKSKVTTLKVTAAILGVVLLGTVGYIGNDRIVKEPYQRAVIELSDAYVQSDYVTCIDCMRDVKVQKMTAPQKFMLANAYVRSENLTQEQKDNILAKMTLNDTESKLDYWIYLGRSDTEQAADIALRLSDDQLLLYAYMKEKAITEENTELTGAEKSDKLNEITKKMEPLMEKYETEDSNNYEGTATGDTEGGWRMKMETGRIRLFRPDYFTIGSRKADIVFPQCKVDIIVKGKEISIHKETEDVLLINDKVIQQDKIFLENGDVLTIGDISVILVENVILIEGNIAEIHTQLPVMKDSRVPFEGFPKYKRSPRIIKRVQEEKIQLEKPKELMDRKKGGLVQLILPPVIMICITIAISVIMKRGLFVVMAVAGTGMSLVVSIMRFFSDKKELKENKILREKTYKQYLLRKRKEIYHAYCKEKEAYEYNYPSVSEIRNMIEEYSPRIYERNYNDEDFLKVSLGVEKTHPQLQIQLKLDELKTKPDILEDEAKAIQREFSVIEKPVVIDLKKAHLGLVGEKSVLHEQIKALICQLTFFHSYHDLEIIAIYDEVYQEDFQWMRWYPHFKIHTVNSIAMINSENKRDQILGSLYQILKDRKQKEEESKKESTFLPHFLFLIDEPKWIMDHSIMEYLEKEGYNLGFSIIYTSHLRANLPENIGTIAMLKNSEDGLLLIDEREEKQENFRLHNMQGIPLEWLGRNLGVLEHMQGISAQIPNSITFFQMYQVERPSQLRIEERWRKNNSSKSLAVPLGARAAGDYVYLNLHEKAHGPHGLVAGTTGSGKSEILQSYILSLAVNFNPYEVAFLLIDYKGGGMSKMFTNLPHLLGTITNLDGSQSMRALASIKSELARRQSIFNQYDVNHINNYNKLFKNGEAEEPLPHLFLISDEFAELKKEQPEFMSELVSAARIGRSLGVHLILATQKPTGVVDDQIWSNSKFKLALKVQNEADSKEILKTADAANITLPGRAYLQVGNNEIYELFQSAWSGAAYNEEEQKEKVDDRVYVLNEIGQGELVNQDLSDTKENNKVVKTQLDAVVRYIHEYYETQDVKAVKKPWLPPLPEQLVSPQELIRATPKELNMKIAMGLIDIPEKQEQIPYDIDFIKDGNLLYIASAGYGKTVFLTTAVLSLAMQNSVQDLNFYILDFGNSGLMPLNKLSHVADYIVFDDSERFQKLVGILQKEIRERKKKLADAVVQNFEVYNQVSAEKMKAIVLVIDNFDVVKELGYEAEEFFQKISRDGYGLGIFVIATATRSNSMKYSTYNNFKNKVAGYLFDESDVNLIVGRSTYKQSETKGRALLKYDNMISVMQLYSMVEFETELEYKDKIEALIQNIDALYPDEQAPRIPVLPENLFFADMKEYPHTEQDIYVGLEKEAVCACGFQLGNTPFTILGEAARGKTNVLKIILDQMLGKGKIYLVDSKAMELYSYKTSEEVVYIENQGMVPLLINALKTAIAERNQKVKEALEIDPTLNPKEICRELQPFSLIVDDWDNFVELTKTQAMTLAPILNEAAGVGISIILTAHSGKMKGFDEVTKFAKNTTEGLLLGNQGTSAIFPINSAKELPQFKDGLLFHNGAYVKVRVPKY